MKKRLDTETISNELKGASLFFQRPQLPSAKASPTPLAPSKPVDEHPERALSSGEERTGRTLRSSRTGRTPQRRFMIRHAFELYQDQVEGLRQLALADRMGGGVGSMSQMVRPVRAYGAYGPSVRDYTERF
jgi:hypothetical protein